MLRLKSASGSSLQYVFLGRTTIRRWWVVRHGDRPSARVKPCVAIAGRRSRNVSPVAGVAERRLMQLGGDVLRHHGWSLHASNSFGDRRLAATVDPANAIDGCAAWFQIRRRAQLGQTVRPFARQWRRARRLKEII